MKLKPYPKYRDSGVPWLGDVPEHWELRKIKFLFREREERSQTSNLKLLSFSRKKGLILYSSLNNRPPSSSDLSKYKVCRLGNLLMNRMQAWSGMFTDVRLEGVVSPDYSVFDVIDKSSTSVSYYSLLFKTRTWVDLFANASKGVGDGFNRLYTPSFGAIYALLPPVEEQNHIVRYLDWKTAQINKFIRNKRRLIQLLKEQKQNIINEAVTKGINPNLEMKDSGVEWLGQIPKHWEVRKLKTIAKIKASGVDKHSRENEIPIQLCNYTDVYKNDKITDSMDFMKATATKEEISNFELVAGDVIITKDSEIWDDIAVPAYVPNSLQNVICAYHLSLIRPRQEYIKGDFLHHCFLAPSLAYQFKVNVTGVTRFGLSQGTIKSALFPVPPIDEQQEIIAYIEKEIALIDKTISRTEREIELINEYRTRLISDVVTGKLDVRGIEIPDFEPVEADLELEEDEESEGELMEEEIAE